MQILFTCITSIQTKNQKLDVFVRNNSPFSLLKKKLSKVIRKLKPYVILLSILLTVLWLNSEKNKIQIAIYDLGYNIYGKSVIFIRKTKEKFTTKPHVEHEMCDLKLVQDMRFLEKKYDILHAENNLLKSQLKLIDNRQYEYITAIVTQVTYPKDEIALIVSAGTKNGVKVGHIVMNEYGIIGRIAQANELFSVVSLIGNENVKIPAVILPSYQDCIVNKGSIKKLTISYLNDLEMVNDGDEVISSGKDGMTPFGLKIGSITKEDGKIFVSKQSQNITSMMVQIIIN